jgi:hypothetical protein
MGESLSKVIWHDPNAFSQNKTKYLEEIKDDVFIERFDNI